MTLWILRLGHPHFFWIILSWSSEILPKKANYLDIYIIEKAQIAFTVKGPDESPHAITPWHKAYNLKPA